MDDLTTHLATMTRPRLLVSAARFGLDDYNRLPALRRLLGVEHLPPQGEILSRLLALEEAQDSLRRDGSAAYRVARHVAVLVALMAEAQMAQPVMKAEVIPLRAVA